MERRIFLCHLSNPKKINVESVLHPFIKGIMEAQLLQGWKTLTIDHYDGLSDPNEHMDTLVT